MSWQLLIVIPHNRAISVIDIRENITPIIGMIKILKKRDIYQLFYDPIAGESLTMAKVRR
jgi:hypothetical protein